MGINNVETIKLVHVKHHLQISTCSNTNVNQAYIQTTYEA